MKAELRTLYNEIVDWDKNDFPSIKPVAFIGEIKSKIEYILSLPVEAQVSDDCERKFTLEEILQLIREEITESYQDDLTAEELKDKIYTIHGFVICALSRKQASNSR